MIREVKDAPLAFEHIVVEAIGSALAEHDFRFEVSTLPEDQDWVFDFTREREGEQQRIRVGRRFYNIEQMSSNEIDDEVDSPRDDAQGRFWASLHYLGVQIITNHTAADLLRTGKAGWSNTGEDWWYFADEAALRQTLCDEVLPLLLTVGLQALDDQLEEAPRLRLFRQQQEEAVHQAVDELPEGYDEQAFKAAVLRGLSKFAPKST